MGQSATFCDHRQRQTQDPSWYPALDSSQATTGAVSPAKSYLTRPRGAQGHNDRKLTKDTKEGTPDLVSFPELPQPQSPDLKPIKMNQCQSTFWRYLGSSWSGLVCPDASSWEHWDLEVATGQTL